MFGTLGGPELFLILVVALIVFGPRKLPEIGKSMGKMMAEFRKASQDFQRTIEDEVEAEKLREATRIDPPAWSSTPAPTPAALPAATTETAGAVTAEHATTAPALAPASPEVRPDAPPDGAPPAETVSRGTIAGESK
jgi:Tat protein translocase TatB subunit